MRVAVFGTGYVGLITGLCFADVGNHVTCVDVDLDKVQKLTSGESPIYEPGIETLLRNNLNKKNISFTVNAKAAIETAEIIFIAVGTPESADGSADLKYVLDVARKIGKHINDYKVIVNKSTVPIGTSDKVSLVIREAIEERTKNVSFNVISNPEFLKEGSAISDCMKPDRIIIGSNSDKATEIIQQLYKPFNRNHNKIIFMDTRSAEMTKYVANAMLATKISFMNEMSQLADRYDANIERVRIGIGSDKRIGPDFIYAGCGFGGSCFPKDIKALSNMGKLVGYETKIINSVQMVNKEQKEILFKKIKKFYNGDLKDKTIAIWGLAFKPNTDDIREASSLMLIESLWREGAYVQAYDPKAMPNFLSVYGIRENYQLFDNAYQALNNADILCILTEWGEFRSPDFELISSKLQNKAIFDGRNLYSKEQLERYSLTYHSIANI